MTYHVEISSTPEFKAYMRTKEKLGGFDNTWNMLKMEAEKKPQDLSITIIDTEYTMRDSFKRATTNKYVDDQILNIFFSYMNREISNGSNESMLSIHCYTTHFLTKLFQEDETLNYTKVSQWCPKDEEGRSEHFFERCSILSSGLYPKTLVFYHGVPKKNMDYLYSMNNHPHAGLYYAIIQYLQREYEQYYPAKFWSDFGWQFHQRVVRKQVNTINCGLYACMIFYFLA
jgi:Ulp1 family protease